MPNKQSKREVKKIPEAQDALTPAQRSAAKRHLEEVAAHATLLEAVAAAAADKVSKHAADVKAHAERVAEHEAEVKAHAQRVAEHAKLVKDTAAKKSWW